MGTPLHRTLADELRTRIRGGALGAGALLPSEAELCREFSTSRGPVRQALAALRDEGLIGGGQGRRPVVLDTVPAQPFDHGKPVPQGRRHAGTAHDDRPGARIEDPYGAAHNFAGADMIPDARRRGTVVLFVASSRARNRWATGTPAAAMSHTAIAGGHHFAGPSVPRAPFGRARHRVRSRA